MDRTVSIEQASRSLETWIRAVSAGDTVTLTRDGEPVAVLAPAPRPVPAAGHRPDRLDPGLMHLLGWEDREEILRRLGE